MPGSNVGKTQQNVFMCLCVGVNDASVTGLERPYTNILVTEIYRHVRLNDVSVDWTWMELSVCSHSLSVALFLTWCLSLSFSLSVTHTHLQPSGLWQDYQTEASVQLDHPPLPCHQTQQRGLQILFSRHQLFFPPYFRTVRHIIL